MTDPVYMSAMQNDEPGLTGPQIIAEYEAGIEALRKSVAGLTPEQIQARPVPGKWSTQEVVSHLADTEIYFTDRIIRTLMLERPLLLDVDERPYIQKLGLQDFDLTEELDLFASLRRHAARLLKRQSPDAWQRKGVHTGTGVVTLRQIVLQAVRHTKHHLPFIAEKCAALAKHAPKT
jgi:uncharacterized damage-inducible protein DinB